MGQDYKHIIQFLTQRHNIEISKYDINFLNSIIQVRLNKTGCNTAASYCTLLAQHDSESQSLINSLNVNHSLFFRNTLTFSVLEQITIPSLVAESQSSKIKEIRVWSAACASGQEAYSLAILLEEHKIITNLKSNFRIFATDQSELHLNEAQIGQYSSASLDNVNLKRINKWFSKKGDTYSVNSELKRNIHFSVFDLLNDQHSNPPSSIYGDFDVVVCANLLFYYRPLYQKKILDKVSGSLSNGGFLITGETERDILLRNRFKEVYPYSAIFHR